MKTKIIFSSMLVMAIGLACNNNTHVTRTTTNSSNNCCDIESVLSYAKDDIEAFIGLRLIGPEGGQFVLLSTRDLWFELYQNVDFEGSFLDSLERDMNRCFLVDRVDQRLQKYIIPKDAINTVTQLSLPLLRNLLFSKDGIYLKHNNLTPEQVKAGIFVLVNRGFVVYRKNDLFELKI